MTADTEDVLDRLLALVAAVLEEQRRQTELLERMLAKLDAIEKSQYS